MRLIFRGDTDPTRHSDVFEYKGYTLLRDGPPVYVHPSVAEEMLAMPQVQFEVVEKPKLRPLRSAKGPK